jgi:hypothetical protein
MAPLDKVVFVDENVFVSDFVESGVQLVIM